MKGNEVLFRVLICIALILTMWATDGILSVLIGVCGAVGMMVTLIGMTD